MEVVDLELAVKVWAGVWIGRENGSVSMKGGVRDVRRMREWRGVVRRQGADHADWGGAC